MFTYTWRQYRVWRLFQPDIAELDFEDITVMWLMDFDGFLAKTSPKKNALMCYGFHGSMWLPLFRVSVFPPEAFDLFAGEHHLAALGGLPVDAAVAPAEACVLPDGVGT
mgnify:CR=1 FL=1